MAIPQLIRTTDTATLVPVDVGGQPVVRAATELRDLLETRLGPGSSGFFAEPAVAGRPGAAVDRVSWFGEQPGEGLALSALTGATKTQAEDQLRQTLRRLAPLIADPRHGPLLRAALVVPGDDDIRMVAGDPVLTNWGFAPQGVDPADPAQIDRHWQATLGRFAAFPSPWRAGAAVLPPDPAPNLSPPPAPAAPAMPSAPPPLAAPAPALLPWYQRPTAWAGCAVAILVAGVAIGLLLRFLLPPAQVATPERLRALIAAQVEVNRGLEQQVQRLRGALAGNVCTADNPLGAGLQQRPVFPVDGEPKKTEAPPKDGPKGPDAKPDLAQGDRLIDMIDAGTVLVIAENSKGTGFFVAPGMVATNRHVVETAKNGKAYIISKALGRVVQAEIVASTPQDPALLRDYALLKVDGAALEKVKVLRITATLDRLDQVVAAGYPGFVINHDAHFQALMKGDLTSVPDAVVSNGVVSTIQSQPQGAGAIIHTAILSHGNSGGPLLDLCGRVVGINTLIALDEKSHRQSNISLTAPDLVQFLKTNNVPVTLSDGRCQAPKLG
ncbi:MAG: trypsin-like peptidase domain-containing protein [Rhodospirillales bacterium]|nr:trypsin-like peptidase domain-containing protein [Rhodospirillales bacterium]